MDNEIKQKMQDFNQYVGVACVKHPSDACLFTYCGYNHNGDPCIIGDFSGGTHNISQYSPVNWDDVQLVLRGYSSMINGEALNFIDVSTPQEDQGEAIHIVQITEEHIEYAIRKRNKLGHTRWKAITKPFVTLTVEENLWLRMRRFDVFELIKQGRAIEKI